MPLMSCAYHQRSTSAKAGARTTIAEGTPASVQGHSAMTAWSRHASHACKILDNSATISARTCVYMLLAHLCEAMATRKTKRAQLRHQISFRASNNQVQRSIGTDP